MIHFTLRQIISDLIQSCHKIALCHFKKYRINCHFYESFHFITIHFTCVVFLVVTAAHTPCSAAPGKGYFPLGDFVRGSRKKVRKVPTCPWRIFSPDDFNQSRYRILVFASRRANKVANWKIGFSIHHTIVYTNTAF